MVVCSLWESEKLAFAWHLGLEVLYTLSSGTSQWHVSKILLIPEVPHSKEQGRKPSQYFFFLWVPSRVTQSARFICGTCCNAERCWLSSYFSHVDIHWLQCNRSWSPKRYKGKISTGCCAAQLKGIEALDLEMCAFPGEWRSSPELDVLWTAKLNGATKQLEIGTHFSRSLLLKSLFPNQNVTTSFLSSEHNFSRLQLTFALER